MQKQAKFQKGLSAKFLFLLSLVIALLQFSAQEVLSQAEEKNIPLSPAEFVAVLPLPGKNGGVFTAIENGQRVMRGVIILPGQDETKEVLAETNSFMAVSPSDVLITIKGEGKWVALQTKEILPIQLTADFSADFPATLMEVLREGRTIKVNKGILIVPVADPSTGQVVESIEYTFGVNATITWDKSKDKPLWRGLSILIK